LPERQRPTRHGQIVSFVAILRIWARGRYRSQIHPEIV
jgi:hypothetical protein